MVIEVEHAHLYEKKRKPTTLRAPGMLGADIDLFWCCTGSGVSYMVVSFIGADQSPCKPHGR